MKVETGGVLKPSSHLRISGLVARVKTAGHEREHYIPALRIAGLPEDLRAYLAELGVPEEQINEYLASAFTSENQGPEFNEEVAAYQAYLTGQKKESRVQKPSILAQLKSGISHQDDTSSKKKAKKTTTEEVQPKRRTRKAVAQGENNNSPRHGKGVPRRELASRLQELQPDEYLDVTNMTATGTGIRKVRIPQGSRTAKVSVDKLKVVSSNAENFYKAMDILAETLGSEYLGYKDKYRQSTSQKGSSGSVLPPPTRAARPSTSAKAASPRQTQSRVAPQPMSVAQPARATSPNRAVSPTRQAPASATMTMPRPAMVGSRQVLPTSVRAR
jgi:hypothetical protein